MQRNKIKNIMLKGSFFENNEMDNNIIYKYLNE